MIKILRNTYHCQGARSWLHLQIGLTCILFMAFWRKPNERGFCLSANLWAHGSHRFGMWLFTGRSNNATWYWCSALLILCMLSGCSASQRTTETFKRDKDGNIVRVTRTVTETIKEEKEIPVTKHVEWISSRTQTTGGREDLHKVEIKSVAPTELPDAVK